jgi:hypothetical protein
MVFEWKTMSSEFRPKPFSELATLLAAVEGPGNLHEPSRKNDSSACAQVIFHQADFVVPLLPVDEDFNDYLAQTGRGRKALPPPSLEDIVPRPCGVRRLLPPEKQENPNGFSSCPRRKGRRLPNEARKRYERRMRSQSDAPRMESASGRFWNRLSEQQTRSRNDLEGGSEVMALRSGWLFRSPNKGYDVRSKTPSSLRPLSSRTATPFPV